MSETSDTTTAKPPVHREKLNFPETAALVELCGYGNARLKLLERTAEVAVHLRGTEITVEGPKGNVAVAVSYTHLTLPTIYSV